MKRSTIFLILLPLALLAQETMIITGRITNFETGVALAGANVMIIGTPYGSAASAVGIYRVIYPLGAAKRDSIQISVNYIGYKSAVLTIPVIAGPNMMDFYLTTDAIIMKEIVVHNRWVEPTRAEKARAYQVITIRREEIELSAASNVLEVLHTRVVGMTLDYPTGNIIGANARIRMRGNSYINNKNTQPLIVLDDVPFQTLNENGTEITDLIKDIILADVEKIEVVKGQGMFWRYGTAAANGCIMIWTKKSTFEHR